MNFSLIILATSEQSQNAGSRILKLIRGNNSEIITLNFRDIDEYIKSQNDESEWNLMFGPGTREIAIVLWGDIISACGKSPKNWVDHRRKSQGGMGSNISGEHAINLFNSSEKYLLGQVCLDDALEIYGISNEEYSQHKGLNWSEKESKFVFKIEVPKNAEQMSNKEARAWEERVVTVVNSLTEKIGKHALYVSRTEVPSSIVYWSNVGERLSDYGIRGGSN